MWYQRTMPRLSHLGPEAYQLGNVQPGGFAIIAVHGFTASPGELRYLADRVAAAGHQVHGMLLPGHGTTEAELASTRRRQWMDAVSNKVTSLRSDGHRVVIVGQSLGGALALHCAADGQVAGVVAFAPALRMPWLASLGRMVSPFVATFPKHELRFNDFVDKQQVHQLWSYDHTPLRAVRELAAVGHEAKARLSLVTCPVLVYSAEHDAMISKRSVEQLAATLPGRVQHVHLANSGHIIPLDAARDQVATEVVSWLQALS
jgi:carboxylesterase